MPKPSENGSVNSQNVRRIRINRIAIIEELRVQDILPYLKKEGVISDIEEKKILRGTTSPDRARILLNILADKQKSTEWYKHFRDALIDFKESDVPEGGRYHTLVCFLDSTIIRKHGHSYTPLSDIDSKVSDMSYPKYDLIPDINGNCQNPETGQNHENCHDQGILVKDTVDVKSRINFSNDNINSIKSKYPDNTDIIKTNDAVFERISKLEKLHSLVRQDKVSKNFVLCLSDEVQDILKDARHFHMYLKYFHQLDTLYLINILKEMSVSLVYLIGTFVLSEDAKEIKEDERNLMIKTSTNLFDLLVECGCYDYAGKVVTALIAYLNSVRGLVTWTAAYQTLLKVAECEMNNLQFNSADLAINMADKFGDAIKMMSFGQDILDESVLHVMRSRLFFDIGSHNAAYEWAQSALKETHSENHDLIVNALVNSAKVNMVRFNLKRAKWLSVEAVKYAKEHFGTLHPMFIKAVLCYLQFANEYAAPDDNSHIIAKNLLEITQLTYDCDCILLAQAHLALSQSLVASGCTESDEFLKHAEKALAVAKNSLESTHPALTTFSRWLSQSIIVRGLQIEDKDMREGYFQWGETEACTSLQLSVSIYGPVNWKTGVTYLQVGQLMDKMKKTVEAEVNFEAAEMILSLCLPSRSSIYKQCLAIVGKFYKEKGKNGKAMNMLKKVVDTTDTAGMYVRWYHDSFLNLLPVLRDLNEKDEAKQYQKKMSKWVTKSQLLSGATWEELNRKATSFEDLRSEIINVANKFKAAGAFLTKTE